MALNSIQNASSVDIETDLGTGNNEGSLSLGNVTGGSTLRSAVRGGNEITERDTVLFSMNGLVDSATVDLQTDTRGGDDTLLAFLSQGTVDVLGTGNLRFHLDGGDGIDDIRFLGDSGQVASTYTIEGVFDITANGGAGSDSISLDLVTNSNDVLVIGDLRVRLNGGGDADTITTEIQLKGGSSDGNVDLAFLGNGGNDTLNLRFTRFEGAGTFGPAGFILMDGGSGTDTGNAFLLVVPPPLRKRNCEA